MKFYQSNHLSNIAVFAIGILFIILGFVLLLLATTEVRKINKEIIKQERLHKSTEIS